MGYIVDFESMADLYSGIDSNYKMWHKGINPLYTALTNIGKSDNIEGDSAEALTEYFETIHKQLLQKIKELIELHHGNYALYYKGSVGYYGNIDTDNFTRIEKSELSKIKSDYTSYGVRAESVDSEVTSIMNSISDIFTYKKKSISKVRKAQKTIVTQVTELDKNINLIENYHYTNDFASTESQIAALGALIDECYSKGREFKASFTAGSVVSLKSWTELNKVSEDLKDDLDSKVAEIKVADKEAKQTVTEIQEYKKREAQAKVWKTLAVGAGVLISVSVIVFTGGAATPLVMGLTGAIVSMETTAVNKLSDEYVQNGNLDNMDWGNFSKDVLVSGATGFVTGYVGGSLAKGVSGTVGNMIGTTNTVGRIATSTISGSITGVANGGIKRGMESVGNTIGDAINGNFDFHSAVYDFTDSVYDLDEMKKDATTGAITGSINGISGEATKKTHFDSDYLNNDNSKVRTISSATYEGVKSGGTGIITRYTEARLDGYSHDEAKEEALDSSKIVQDVIKDGGKSGANAYVDKSPIGDKITAKDLNDPKIRNKLPDDVVSDPDNWLKNGGKIYMDSKGRVTYEAKNLKYDNTIATEPTEKIYYGSRGGFKAERSDASKNSHQVGGHFSRM